MIKKAVCGLLLAGFVLFLRQADAAEETAGDTLVEIGTKFGRGLENVVTSPAEIPCTMAEDMRESAAAGFFTGFGKGTVFMLRRILVGVTEIGTFVIPMERTIPRVCSEK